MGDVVKMGGGTTHRVEPDRVLTGHMGQLTDCVLIGIDKDGDFTAACSNANLERAVFLAQKFVSKAVRGDYGNPVTGMELFNG